MQKTKPLILIAEDDSQLTEVLTKQLNLSGLNVQVFQNGTDTVNFLKRNFASVILLDINLPDVDGFNVIHQLRSEGISTPVIFLTGFSDEFYKLKGFDVGADDFVTKPFSFTELVARVRAVLKRTSLSGDFSITGNAALNDDDFEFCGAKVSPAFMHIVFPNKNKVRIGKKEIGILKHFAYNADMILSRKNIIHSVWGEHANVRSRSMDQYIVKLRQIFKNNDCSMDRLRTLHGIGYTYCKNSSTPLMTRREYADFCDVL
ncbi:MAG: response regulator transcription factor [Puniceicoccales bacterium]|jgi:two-component system alkaline phosphatase synthesis response regulator PhoP|nr:response regulator transcription factor [Puniceicoccales bacterium]